MKFFIILLFFILLHTATFISAWRLINHRRSKSPQKNNASLKAGSGFSNEELTADPCTLPGDPSLLLHTSVDLGDEKVAIMKKISKIIADATGKPESYIAVMIDDNAAMIWGGEERPCALGCMYSIGAIAMESNGQITAGVTDCMKSYGVDPGNVYINFFDVPRANVGWNGKTFAG